jgi:hypothetical protein
VVANAIAIFEGSVTKDWLPVRRQLPQFNGYERVHLVETFSEDGRKGSALLCPQAAYDSG